MMKRAFFIIALLNSFLLLSEEGILYESMMDNLMITENRVKYSMNEGFSWGDVPSEIILDNYVLNNEHDLPYYIGEDGTKLLILKDEKVAVAYMAGRKRIIFAGGVEGLKLTFSPHLFDEAFYSPQVKEASSFLTEGKVEYKASNVGSLTLETSWVEGAKGFGIGETINFEEFFGNGLYFFNGYVSFDKPHLYKDNSRVKKIKFTDFVTGEEFIFDLEDTPNPQELSLPKEKKWNLKMEILEVYEGKKYKDTCIHSLKVKRFLN